MNDHHPALTLAEALLKRQSVTPEDAGCLELIEARLAPLGFSCQRHDRAGIANLWARRGTTAPLFCFAGHTDVVPSGPVEAWQSPPFAPTRRDGRLYARGATDMKSSIACAVVAVEEFIASHPDHPGSIAFLLTADEEGPATDGTVAVVEWLKAQGQGIDYCLVGEPTSVDQLGDMVKNGRRGSLSGQLVVKGIQGHIAYPHLARNPIHQIAPVLATLAAEKWDDGNEFFPPTTWQVSNIHGGTGANNVIPGSVELLFNFRFSTASTPESLQARLEARLQEAGLDYELAWTLGARPFLAGRGELVQAAQEAIRETCGVEPELSTTGGTSDGRFIADICPQVMEFGPINLSAHKIDEHIELAAFPRLTAAYRGIIERLLK